eukprot:3275079-Alexandrium_andersonii.AAC.1
MSVKRAVDATVLLNMKIGPGDQTQRRAHIALIKALWPNAFAEMLPLRLVKRGLTDEQARQ